MVKLSTEELLAIEEFNRVNEQFNNVSDSLEEICLRGVKRFTDAKDFKGAREYLNQLPDSLARIYVADHIRVTRGDYNEE